MRLIPVGAVVLALAAPATAQVIEDFEHGNVGLYSTSNANLNMSIVAGAAHDGALGAQFAQIVAPAFFYRTDVPTSPGNTYYTYVRVNGSAGGRLYFGVAASAAGAYSAIAAPNTNELILQNNTGWGFAIAAAVPATYLPDTWYRLGVDWAANGDMKAVLWDEGGTLITETAAVATGPTPAGGIVFRGFHPAGLTWQADTVSVEGVACYPDCNGVGGLTIADFGCFQTAFVAGDPYADCNGVGGLTIADFGCFQTAFVAGCP